MNKDHFLIRVVITGTGTSRYVMAERAATTQRDFAQVFPSKEDAQRVAKAWKRPGLIVRTNKVYTSPKSLGDAAARERDGRQQLAGQV